MILDLNKDFDRNKFISFVEKLSIGRKKIEIKEIKPTRTINQNSYLHVCITLYAISSGEYLEDAKYHLKINCPFMHEYQNGKIKTVQTRSLDTKQLTEFIEWIRNYASINLGCYIPTSEEFIQNQFDIRREIEAHKEYL